MKPVVFESPASIGSPCSAATSSPISPGSSSASSVTNGSPTEVLHDLLDQLQTSYETRFHACWMFLRYFYLIMSPRASRFPELVSSQSDTDFPSKLEREGLELVTLDISVACLSLSVKFHRDFLDPLLPVYAQEYLALSPHGMSYDDLEVARSLINLVVFKFPCRRLIATFSPHSSTALESLLSCLWMNCGLRYLRSVNCYVLNKVGVVQWNMHGQSFSAQFPVISYIVFLSFVCLEVLTTDDVEVDVQVFSISLLTTVAVMDGVIQSLVHEDREGSTTGPRSEMLGPITSGPSSRSIGRNPYRAGISLEQARIEAEHVLREIQSLVGVSDVSC